MTVNPRDKRIMEECFETDEPCTVFRAKDKHYVNVMEFYFQQVQNDPDAEESMKDAVARKTSEARYWQDNNEDKVHTPDLRPGEY